MGITNNKMIFLFVFFLVINMGYAKNKATNSECRKYKTLIVKKETLEKRNIKVARDCNNFASFAMEAIEESVGCLDSTEYNKNYNFWYSLCRILTA